MNKHNQDGAINALLVPLIVASLLFVGALAFGFWAFGERTNYKNNVDQITAQAVTAARQQEDTTKDKQFAEASKSPYKTYTGPSEFGSVQVTYPKTWSAYIDHVANGQSFDGYFQPNVVPSASDQTNSFALRISVVNQKYSDIAGTFTGQTGVTVAPYTLPKLPKVVGIRVTGQISQQKQGDMVIFPLRDSTLEVFTQSTAYETDFSNVILPNFTFSP